MDLRVFWLILALELLKRGLCCSEPKCNIQTVYKMKAADCFNRDLKDFPQCVPSNVEIIDASYNRIRRIKKNDLKRYPDLKMLYLSDNSISSIDKDALSDKDSLEILDLTLNSMIKLPPMIFQLPSLKTLYLGQNRNINIIDALEQVQIIKSPLVSLDISYITDEEDTAEFPYFGTLPQLRRLNLTGNNFYNVSPRHFAGMCNLKFLINENATATFEDACDCFILNKWLTERSVEFRKFQCEEDEANCVTTINEDDRNIFESCKKTSEEIQKQDLIWKIFKYSGIVFLVALSLFLLGLLYLKANKPKHNKIKNMQEIPIQLSSNLLLN